MRAGSGGRLSAALTCVLLLGAAGVRAAAPPDAALDALRDIAAKTQDTTRETLAAHVARRDTDAATIDATKALRGRLDAIAHQAAAAGYRDDAVFSRKARRVADLLANLERATAAPRDALLPALIPTVAGLIEGTPGAQVGTRCATALAVGTGVAIDAMLSSTEAAGSTLWLRIAPSKARFVRIDTAPSALDTEITVFGADCPAAESEAVATNDDAFGLAAAVAIDAERAPGFHYVRVRNLGHAAGAVIARVSEAGAIVGRITDVRDGQPIYAYVYPATPDGYVLPGVSSDGSTGLYLLAVDPGSYYVVVESPYSRDFPYVSELYPDAPCQQPDVFNLSDCDTASATLLTIADGQQIAGIDVALGVGARVAGIVRDATTGAPLANANVAVYGPGGSFAGFAVSSDVAGRYIIPDLLTGNYSVVVSRDGYGSQMWDHITCGGPVQTDCDFESATPLALVRDTVTTGIDFDLPTEAHIHATVSTSDGAPYPASGWVLTLYNQSGNYVGQSYVYGTAEVDSQALPAGGLYAFVTATDYFGQLWNGVDCLVDCTTQLNQGTVITLAPGQVANVTFPLRHVPKVTGTITDAATHAPLSNVNVTLVSTDFGDYANGYTDNTGHYAVTPHAVGNYYVLASSSDHRGTLYPDVPCLDSNVQNCDTGAATQVAIAYGGSDATGIDIAMPLDGSVSGHIALHTPDGMNLAPIIPQNAFVQVSTLGGTYVGTGFADMNGTYQITNLPEGTYYAIVQGEVFSQIYPHIDCDTGTCSPLEGSPITVASGTDTGSIDFDPVPLDYIFGRVTDADGAPIPGVAIDVWHPDGVHCGVSVTNADGYYAATHNLVFCVNDPPLLSTDAGSSIYENEVYDDIPCPLGSVYLGLCSLDGATPVPFPTTLTQVIANFTLGLRPDAVFANGFDQ